MDIRKIIAGIAAFTLVCGAAAPAANTVITPFTAVAATETVTEGALTFKVFNGVAAVDGCAKDAVGEIIVPETVDGAAVVCVNPGAFMDCIGISSVTLPDTVETIMDEAFCNCANLSEVKLPEKLWFIDNKAFILCKALKSIDLPENLQTIGEYAFAGSGLVDVTIPKNVEEIQRSAFAECADLKSIAILNPKCRIASYESTICAVDLSSSSLHNSYFSGVIRGASGSTAEKYAGNFGYTFEPLSDIPSADLTFTLKDDHYSVSAGNTTISGNVDIPAKYEGLPVTEIGMKAFWNCGNITSVSLPETITTIGSGAFYGCKNLQKLTILSTDCDICDSADTVTNAVDPSLFTGTIFGYAGSTAENFARKYGHNFKALDGLYCTHGDANCDGQVTIADAAAVAQYLGNGDKYPLSAQGRKNASLGGDGVISTADILYIQQLAAGIFSDQWHEKHDLLDRLKKECAGGELTKTYPAEDILGDIWHSGGINQVTFIDELNEKYPIEHLAAPENSSPYAVYRLDSGEKLFVFFYDGADFLVPVTRIAVVGDMLTNADLTVKTGMTLAEVESLDPGVKLINSIDPQSLHNISQTFHMTAEGFWQITYEGEYPQCTVAETKFIPNSGVMTEPVSGGYREIPMTVDRHELFGETMTFGIDSANVESVTVTVDDGGVLTRTFDKPEDIEKAVTSVNSLHMDTIHPEDPKGEMPRNFTIELKYKDGSSTWLYIDSRYALFEHGGEKKWSAVDPVEYTAIYQTMLEMSKK